MCCIEETQNVVPDKDVLSELTECFQSSPNVVRAHEALSELKCCQSSRSGVRAQVVLSELQMKLQKLIRCGLEMKAIPNAIF